MTRTYIKLLLTALFWGGTFVAAKFVSQNLGSFSIALLRFAAASVLLLALTRAIEGKLPRPKPSQLAPIAILSLTGVSAYNVMFFVGLQTVEASRASLIVATCPAFIALASAVFLKERFTVVKTAGIVLSLCGAVVVISRGHLSMIVRGGIGLGELCIFGCVFCWVVYSMVGRHVMRRMSPIATVAYSAALGAAVLLAPALATGLTEEIARASALDWLCILYLAIFGTVIGFVWYYQGVARIGPTKAGLFINFVPVFGVALAYLILDEPITISLAAGAVLVVGGVCMTNRSPGAGRA